MKVSIVMTCYNTSKYVNEAIRSVVQQSYKNWELIIVDDASTDDTVSVVTKSIADFKIGDRTKVFVHKRNCGCGKSLSDAIRYSSGDLVAVLDSDDVLAPNVLSLVVPPHIANRHISLVYTNYMVCDSNMNQLKLVKNFHIPPGQSYMHHMKGVSHLKCFKKSMYQKTAGLDESLLKSVDKDLILKLEEVGTLHYVDTVGYFYRHRSSSLSNSFFKRPREQQLKMRQDRKSIVQKARIRRSKGIIS